MDISKALSVNGSPVACSRRDKGRRLALLLLLSFADMTLEELVLEDIALEERDSRFLLS